MDSEYAKHEFEVICFSTEDVIVTSDPETEEDEVEIDVVSDT